MGLFMLILNNFSSEIKFIMPHNLSWVCTHADSYRDIGVIMGGFIIVPSLNQVESAFVPLRMKTL